MAKAKHLHEKLRITFVELGALLGVRELLKMKLMTWEKGDTRHPRKGEHLFNMNLTLRKRGCGSVGCIGGSMGMLMGMDQEDADTYVSTTRSVLDLDGPFNGHSKTLTPLFYPPWLIDFSGITPAQGIKAINNFLKTGKPQWEKVLPKALYPKHRM